MSNFEIWIADYGECSKEERHLYSRLKKLDFKVEGIDDFVKGLLDGSSLIKGRCAMFFTGWREAVLSLLVAHNF